VDNVFGTHVGLVVIDVGCAVGAVIAVDGIPGVANVGVHVDGPLCELEVLLRNDLVERVLCAAELFARIAMA